MGVKYFEDLEVWKSARELTGRIYSITADGTFSRNYGLRDECMSIFIQGWTADNFIEAKSIRKRRNTNGNES